MKVLKNDRANDNKKNSDNFLELKNGINDINEKKYKN